MSKITDIGRWRSELILAEEFRDQEFGKYSEKEITKTGENIDYFEKGYSSGFMETNDDTTATLNFFHVITKLVVPTLFFQNPSVQVQPKRKIDQDSAPVAKEIINYYYKELDVDFENELVVWDGYVLNRGICKVGYATKFGMDVPDETPRKEKGLVDRTLEKLGLKEGEKKEILREEINQKIISESPYTKWVDPYRFLMDPRARTIDEAMWVAEEFDKTVAELKRNPKYKNTDKLVGKPQEDQSTNVKIPDTEIEEFSVVRLYQIHYRNRNKMYLLVIVKDGEVYKELYHDESMYEMDGFQYDILEYTRHGHLQFKRSDLAKIKNLQDRFTSTLDAILEQLDRFVPKILVLEGGLTPEGENALRDGDVGAVVKTTSNPQEVVKELALTQYKADLKAIMDEFVNIITIMTGITRTKLLGISTADTATGENIAQGGESIRISDMNKATQRFAKRQSIKLWQVIKQFVPLEELELITGESGIDPQTGSPIYTWLPDIDSEMSQKLAEGQYRFDIDVASTQKIDSTVITKRIENLISILARTDVIALMQQQGKKVDVAEILRLWLQNTPEIVRDPSRIIQDVNANTQGLLPAEDILVGGRGGNTAGSNLNEARRQEAQPPVSLGV